MHVSAKFEKMQPAPVDTINAVRRSLESQGRNIINLGQAIPDLMPPAVALEQLHLRMKDSSTHLYTSDQGLPDLREELARSLESRYGAASCHADRIIITAGANHAFLITCMTLLEPSDNVGLISPHFLNHEMIVRACGATVVELAMPPDMGQFSSQAIGDLIEEYKLRMLVLVNPCNPSGRIIPPPDVVNLWHACRRTRAIFVVDEVYRVFVPDPGNFKSAASLASDGSDDATIVVGSFSKEFGMSGWRVGWLLSPVELIPHFIKAQDLSLICAPHVSQELALLSLRLAPAHALTKQSEYAARREIVRDKFRRCGLFELDAGEGAFFVWFRPLKAVDSKATCLELMTKCDVCIMPGTFFGKAWQSWFRLSYGSTEIEELAIGAQRIVDYFGS